MSGEELFSDLPIQRDVRVADPGAPRMREPVRDQIELRAVDLEALVAAEHPVRVIWAYVEQLDLRELEEAIRARTHTAGQAPASPRLLLALWLYATSEGVGSARALARLCESHDVYRWLCGGVSVNYHGLADFRTAHPELLDRLLSENVASLSVAEVIDLDEVAQDGVRVRAAAGTGSFRRRKKLHKELRKAQRLIRQLKEETTDDPQASSRRIVAAKERAAREREARVAAALKKLAEIEAERERRSKTNKKQVEKQKEPRASTTDPDARVMKMADGGFRPAYNVHLVSDTASKVVVAVDVDNAGTDKHTMVPLAEQVEKRYQVRPQEWLTDGGCNSLENIDRMIERECRIFAPLPRPRSSGRKPTDIRPTDSEAVREWRGRMGTKKAKAIYKERGATAELVNAQCRGQGLVQFLVRGTKKVLSVVLLHAITHNMRRGWAFA